MKNMGCGTLLAIIMIAIMVGICTNDESPNTTPETNAIKVPAKFQGKSRSQIAQTFNAEAKELGFLAEFMVDPNNDQTLVIVRTTTLHHSKIQNWTNYLLTVGTNTGELKAMGFRVVRIYAHPTGQMPDITDYTRKLLLNY